MKHVIVTKRNEDKSYDDVGVNNRKIFNLRTLRGIVNRCRNTKFATDGDKIRIQWFGLYSKPYAVTYVIIDGPYQETHR